MSFSVQFVIASAAAMLLNAAVVPVLVKLAVKHEWYDMENNRKIHQGKIPRIGGIGIVLSFFTVIFLFFLLKSIVYKDFSVIFSVLKNYWTLLIGAAVINIIGLLDDFTDLRPLYKLWVQMAIALFIIICGYFFKSFHIPFFNTTFSIPAVGIVVTFFWIVGITNAVNLIDGMDGLSSGVAGIAAFFMGLSAFASGNVNQAILVFVLFGSLAGFLIYNFPPARLFMGDSGSLFIGFVLAVLPIYSLPKHLSPYMLILAVSFLFIPILDTIAAIIRRRIKGVPFHTPDREHLHHKLLALGLSQKQVLAVIYSVTLLISFTAYMFVLTGKEFIIILLIAQWVVFSFLFYLLSRAAKAKLS